MYRKYKFSFFLLLSVLGACYAQKTKKITINKGIYANYPAVILDLRNDSLILINNNMKDLEITGGDLWIEPRDPEIGGMPKTENRIGSNVYLKLISGNLSDKQKKKLDISKFQEKIKSSEIETGIVFVVKASDEKLYRIKITYLNEKEEEMKLEYRSIN